ncbi:hypothetical protein PoB_007491600 [Plakobranchus ocellatus]|uniref:Uncharacterized protein n=1 Tax=Plakobranchus ocellatus TaxID=259542 RepID=A0AAV4DWB8_9GAST|nr:hypothetical protein PoB_007491600 [Plakobranchus ocellatus]
MQLQGEANVAATNCSKVIEIVSNHVFGQKILDLPSTSCSLNIADEAHHVAKVKKGDEIKKFLGGGVYGDAIPDSVMEILNTCPLTNLVGERLFGDLDFDMTKRRHSSLHHRSMINM